MICPGFSVTERVHPSKCKNPVTRNCEMWTEGVSFAGHADRHGAGGRRSSQTAAWHAPLPTLDVVDAKGVYRYFSVEEKDLDAVVEKLVKEAESGK